MGAALADELAAAREQVGELLASLQAAPSIKQADLARQKLDAWHATVEGAARSTQARAEVPPEEALPGGEVRPGVRVKIVSLDHEGEVLEVDGGEALVRAGALKMRRPLSDLLPLRGKARAAAFSRSKDERLSRADAARPEALLTAERRLDVRGLRVEELLREVERFLDGLYSGGEPSALILHGHGTGALKQALREHLRPRPTWAPFDPAIGTRAATRSPW